MLEFLFCNFLIKIQQLRLLSLDLHYTTVFICFSKFSKKNSCSKFKENMSENLSKPQHLLTSSVRRAQIKLKWYDQQQIPLSKHYVIHDYI